MITLVERLFSRLIQLTWIRIISSIEEHLRCLTFFRSMLKIANLFFSFHCPSFPLEKLIRRENFFHLSETQSKRKHLKSLYLRSSLIDEDEQSWNDSWKTSEDEKFFDVPVDGPIRSVILVERCE